MRLALVLLAALLFAGAAFAQPAALAPCLVSGTDCASSIGSVTTTGTLASGQVALGSGATSVTSNDGLTHQGSGTTFKLGLGTRVFMSAPSAGTLLVEDGSGNARDVQARTGTFGASVVTPVVDSGGGSSYLTFTDYHAGAPRLMYFDAGMLYPGGNNIQDIGADALKWRTGYFSTSLYSPLLVAAPVATGTNTAGANLTIQPQAGTGSATGSSIVFQTPTATTSGTTGQTQTTRLTVDESGITATYAAVTGQLYAAQITTAGVVRLTGYTVATLPAGTVGDTAYVTDATAPTYLGALTGGGAVTTPVFYNGAAWVSH